ncbi:SMR family transporter [Bacillus songklensis]|uniref:SMR family transporter n=1 Tax=Bacillus songklensis TaxID=1069116 RepID=A0ABV8B064_9BACI
MHIEAYAVWSGVSTAAIALIGVLIWKEKIYINPRKEFDMSQKRPCQILYA